MNTDAERAVLASILYDYGDCTYAFDHLKPDHFKKSEHRGIFSELTNLHNNGVTVDVITATQKTSYKEIITEISSEGYTTTNLRTHANIVLDRYFLREGYKKLSRITEQLKTNPITPAKLQEKIEEISLFLCDRAEDKGLRSLKEISKSVKQNFKVTSEGHSPGIKIGFRDFDKKGLFFRKKTLTIIAARPSMGKSALMIAIAKKSGKKCAVFSIEMGADEQYERLLSPEVHLSNDEFRKIDVLNAKQKSIQDAMEEINRKRIWISESRKVTVASILSQSKRLKALSGLDVVFIDYGGLMHGTGRSENREKEVTQISQGLKYISEILDIPVVALWQLNRNCEARPDKRPMLSDLRESGSLEQDAHMVWFVYRKEVYFDENIIPGKTEIMVAKNRSGPVGTLFLSFEGRYTNFKDYDEPSDENFTEGIPDWHDKT